MAKGKKVPEGVVLERFRVKHGDRYQYDMAHYSGALSKIRIRCEKHGWFSQAVYSHSKGQGCPQCARENKYLSPDEFLRKLVTVHGTAYNYDKVHYLSTHSEITLICPEHGEFEIKASYALQGQGCKACGVLRRSKNSQMTYQRLVGEMKRRNIADISCVEDSFVNRTTKAVFRCQTHGEFGAVPNDILNGKGCPSCWENRRGLAKRVGKGGFLTRAEELFGERYSYTFPTPFTTLVDTKILVTCPSHGEFETTAYLHLNSSTGCPSCGRENTVKSQTYSKREWEELAREKHGDTYEYSNCGYRNCRDKITLTCEKHGGFEIAPYLHLQGQACPRCAKGAESLPQEELGEYLADLGQRIEFNNRGILSPQEIDLWLPEKNIGVEYCGLHWHSSDRLGPTYHLEKLQRAQKEGIRLITVFEDEYLKTPKIVTKLLRNFTIGKPSAIGSRSCQVVETDYKEVKDFYYKNHIQGALGASHHFALIYKNNVVAAASFGRVNKRRGTVELVRFAVDLDIVVYGALEKLTKIASSTFSGQRLLSYCDRRWFTGKNYLQAGFTLTGETSPNYWYFRGQTFRLSRQTFMKKKLHKKLTEFDPGKTEAQNMAAHGFKKIHDCGNLLFTKPL